MSRRAPHGPAVLLLAGVVVLGGCSAAPVVSKHSPTPNGPSVVGFTSSGGTCVDQPRLGWSVQRSVGGESAVLTVRGNASVPGASYGLEAPTVTRTGRSTYALNVSSRRATEKPSRECRAVVRYTAHVRLPVGSDDRFALVVYHDGQEATAVGFDPGGSGAGSNASAGG